MGTTPLAEGDGGNLEILTESGFVNLMDGTAEYQKLHADLLRQLKQGWMDVSRAKYSMGIKSVSQTQYPDDAEADVTVESTSNGPDILEVQWQNSAGSAKHLYSFGGIVSPHLRSAQAAFTDVLNTAIKLSNAASCIKRQLPLPPKAAQ